jgi:hypothetical protein
MQSNINIGFRHALPMYALAIIVASYPFSLVDWKKAASSVKFQASRLFLGISMATGRIENRKVSVTTSPELETQADFLRRLLLPTSYLLLLFCIIATGLLAFPNDLSYYNILSGEPRPIPYISADSNIDWGQSSKTLYAYMQQHKISHIAFDNFTGTTVAEARNYPIAEADPTHHNYHGYLALSRSTIIDHLCTKNNDWGWVVDNKKPIAVIGGSVNLYKL